MRAFRFGFFAVAILLNACSGGGHGSDAGTDASGGDAGGMDAKVPPDAGNNDTGTTDAPYDGPVLNAECTVPADAASGGSCITLTGDGGVECNPITNAPCNTAGGEACDLTNTGGYHCFPPPNPQTTCQSCDYNTMVYCAGTNHCVPGNGGNGICARFCCADGDCGSGHCDKTTLGTTPVGFCVQ